MSNDLTLQKFSVTKIILLHLIPGLINLIVIFLILPITNHFGLVSLTAGLLMVPFGMVPLQLGILLYFSKKLTNSYNILKIIPFQKKNKIIEYLLFVVIMIVWALLISRLLESFEIHMRDSIFLFVPDYIALRNIDLNIYSKYSLIFIAILGIISNGIMAPIIEEMYFRGFLLPRIKFSPICAVIMNAALFSLYHFFSPWQFFSRFFMMVPMYYWVIKRQNIRFSLMAHIIGNLYSSVDMLIVILAL